MIFTIPPGSEYVPHEALQEALAALSEQELGDVVSTLVVPVVFELRHLIQQGDSRALADRLRALKAWFIYSVPRLPRIKTKATLEATLPDAIGAALLWLAQTLSIHPVTILWACVAFRERARLVLGDATTQRFAAATYPQRG